MKTIPLILRHRERGAAAVELAAILSATMVLMPAVALFARVFFQYSVVKEATRDAAVYMATVPRAALHDETERTRTIAIAQRMVSDAALAAGMTGTTQVAPAYVECDNATCFGAVPEILGVTVTFRIDDQLFGALTGRWTDRDHSFWQVSARSTVPYTR